MDELFNESIWAFKQKGSGNKLERDVQAAAEMLKGKDDRASQDVIEASGSVDQKV
jgi:hypothetical protein